MEHNSPLHTCWLQIVTSFQRLQYEKTGEKECFILQKPGKHYCYSDFHNFNVPFLYQDPIQVTTLHLLSVLFRLLFLDCYKLSDFPFSLSLLPSPSLPSSLPLLTLTGLKIAGHAFLEYSPIGISLMFLSWFDWGYGCLRGRPQMKSVRFGRKLPC